MLDTERWLRTLGPGSLVWLLGTWSPPTPSSSSHQCWDWSPSGGNTHGLHVLFTTVLLLFVVPLCHCGGWVCIGLAWAATYLLQWLMGLAIITTHQLQLSCTANIWLLHSMHVMPYFIHRLWFLNSSKLLHYLAFCENLKRVSVKIHWSVADPLSCYHFVLSLQYWELHGPKKNCTDLFCTLLVELPGTWHHPHTLPYAVLQWQSAMIMATNCQNNRNVTTLRKNISADFIGNIV